MTRPGTSAQAMRYACIAAVKEEQKYESSDFPVCNAIVRSIQDIPVEKIGEQDLLDFFAARALGELSRNRDLAAALSWTKDPAQKIASLSYDIAEAMVEERSKRLEKRLTR